MQEKYFCKKNKTVPPPQAVATDKWSELLVGQDFTQVFVNQCFVNKLAITMPPEIGKWNK
ncbi:MAG: hypothetical protein IPN76_12600 [Saprospiraceae bacterium]|nr:hypothetical protein [Saprospiraceae bacterium]